MRRRSLSQDCVVLREPELADFGAELAQRNRVEELAIHSLQTDNVDTTGSEADGLTSLSMKHNDDRTAATPATATARTPRQSTASTSLRRLLRMKFRSTTVMDPTDGNRRSTKTKHRRVKNVVKTQLVDSEIPQMAYVRPRSQSMQVSGAQLNGPWNEFDDGSGITPQHVRDWQTRSKASALLGEEASTFASKKAAKLLGAEHFKHSAFQASELDSSAAPSKPSSREKRSHTVRLREVLDDPALCILFAAFLKCEHADESLSFYSTAQEFSILCAELDKPLQKSRVSQAAKALWAQFLSPNAATPININAPVRAAVEMRIETSQFAEDLFSDAQSEVFNMLCEDSFRRFLRWKPFKERVSTKDSTLSLENRPELRQSKQSADLGQIAPLDIPVVDLNAPKADADVHSGLVIGNAFSACNLAKSLVEAMISDMKHIFAESEARDTQFDPGRALTMLHALGTDDAWRRNVRARSCRLLRIDTHVLEAMNDAQRFVFFVNLFNAGLLHALVHHAAQERELPIPIPTLHSDTRSGAQRVSSRRFLERHVFLIGSPIRACSLFEIKYAILKTVVKPSSRKADLKLQFPPHDPRISLCLARPLPLGYFMIGGLWNTSPGIAPLSLESFNTEMRASVKEYCMSKVEIVGMHDAESKQVMFVPRLFQWALPEIAESDEPRKQFLFRWFGRILGPETGCTAEPTLEFTKHSHKMKFVEEKEGVRHVPSICQWYLRSLDEPLVRSFVDSNGDVNGDFVADSNGDSTVDSNDDSTVDSNGDSTVDSNADSTVDSNGDSTINPTLDSNNESMADLNNDASTNDDLGFDCVIELNVESSISTIVTSNFDSNVDSSVNSAE